MDKKTNPINLDPNIEESHQDGTEDTRYWQDSNQLLALFPPEVWDHICIFLDSSDFLNLLNSSPFFRDLFHRQRVLLLFQPVLEMLLPKLEEYSEEPISPENEQDEENQGIVRVRPTHVNCREVCQHWKWTIDKLASTLKPEEPRSKYLVQFLLSQTYLFRESGKIDKFLQYFNTTHPPHVSPFPGKYIDLLIGLQKPDYPHFSNQISKLMEKYGPHIWTIDLCIMFGNENPPEIHHKLVEWLKNMPNLQNLMIFYFIPLEPHILNQVQPEFVPLPKSTSLRKLGIQTMCPPVSDEHIPDSWSWIERYNLRSLVDQSDNLDFLQITIMNKKDNEILERVTSPLKTLLAQYHCKENGVSLSGVFTMLSEKFSNSLEYLRLSFRVSNKLSEHNQILEDSFHGRLSLLRVKRIEIHIVSMFCLDFLLGMTENLEELIINCVGGSRGGVEYSDFSVIDKCDTGIIAGSQIIKFLGYQDKMLESNIWNVFPKLQKISLTASSKDRKCKEFTRKDWMKSQEFN